MVTLSNGMKKPITVNIELERKADVHMGMVFINKFIPDQIRDDYCHFICTLDDLRDLYNNMTEFFEEYDLLEKHK